MEPLDREGYLDYIRRSPWALDSKKFEVVGASAKGPRWNGVPIEWVADAWDLPEVQAGPATDMVEYVRKWPPEPFFHPSCPCVETAAACLRPEQIVRLYKAFRERWPACEPQFVEEFTALYGDRLPPLPPMFTLAEVTKRFGGDEATARELMAKYYRHPALEPPAE